MSSNEDLIESGSDSEVVSDLYALKQMLFESDLEPKTYYLQRIEGGFIRPSFLIKIVNFALVPYNDKMSWIDEDVMIQYFSEDMIDAQAKGTKVMNILSRAGVGVKDVILPRYDFSTSPPTKIPVSYRDNDGNLAGPSAMGARINPESIRAAINQEDDERWNIAITFTMRSPSIPCRPALPVIRDLHITRIGAMVPVEFLDTGISLESDTE